MNSKKIKKQLNKVTKNEVALSNIINKFAKENNICLNNLEQKDYKKILQTLKSEEIDCKTMLKLMERFK